ncbi:MAG: prolyl oligopeptidase family serine peptidase, partial [Pseudomonadota bacterium]
IGFSQGAYLSPHVAMALPNVNKVVGIGGRFYSHDFASVPRFKLRQVHGQEDQVVDPNETELEHKKLKQRGVDSDLAIVSGAGHEINEPVSEALEKFLLHA